MGADYLQGLTYVGSVWALCGLCVGSHKQRQLILGFSAIREESALPRNAVINYLPQERVTCVKLAHDQNPAHQPVAFFRK